MIRGLQTIFFLRETLPVQVQARNEPWAADPQEVPTHHATGTQHATKCVRK